MLSDSPAFSGYSVNDTAKAKDFYQNILGVHIQEDIGMGGLLTLTFPGGGTVMLYPKPDHQPATFTVLNFPVDNIDTAVDNLAAKGVQFLQYDEPMLKTDQKGISRSENDEFPSIAWFTDPAGNILSVIEEDPRSN